MSNLLSPLELVFFFKHTHTHTHARAYERERERLDACFSLFVLSRIKLLYSPECQARLLFCRRRVRSVDREPTVSRIGSIHWGSTKHTHSRKLFGLRIKSDDLFYATSRVVADLFSFACYCRVKFSLEIGQVCSSKETACHIPYPLPGGINAPYPVQGPSTPILVAATPAVSTSSCPGVSGATKTAGYYRSAIIAIINTRNKTCSVAIFEKSVCMYIYIQVHVRVLGWGACIQD